MRGSRIAGVAVAASVVIAGITQARAEPRGVVELFTSQGCSSCPPADELIGRLSHDPSLIVLSVPIDYWDYLGWKDTLAKPRHSARQRGYAKTRGDREVYTPQAVVNGSVHALGSDRAAIEGAVAESRKKPNILTLPVTLSVSAGKVQVKVGDAGAASGGEVWLCPISKAVPVTIGRGENNGRTITYYNVVRRWIKLGDWNGTTQSFTLPMADFGEDSVDAVVVIVQAGSIEKPGPMLGAALAVLH